MVPTPPPPPSVTSITFSVKIPSGEMISITANPTDTIAQVKQLIMAQRPEFLPSTYNLMDDTLLLVETRSLVD
jgi:hypothetical protein